MKRKFCAKILKETVNHPVYRWGGCRICDRMEVGFTTTYAISTYHHWSWEFESHSWRDALITTLCDKVCQWLVAGLWFSSTNITPPRYDWNIVKSGVKHHNLNPNPLQTNDDDRPI